MRATYQNIAAFALESHGCDKKPVLNSTPFV
jgi:hypothetical protein